jgi:GntR family transcriptional repressor for pyruvate dehydrogenase complex
VSVAPRPEQLGAAPPLMPIRSVNVFEETVERLLALVKLGVLAPGDRLPSERELAQQLEISRPTVREALRSLGRTGYLTTLRGRFGGTYVLDWSPEPSGESARAVARAMGDELTDALDFRLVVEPGAAALAAERLEPADVPRLDAALALVAEAPQITFPAEARPAIDGGPDAAGEAETGPTPAPLSYRLADRRLHLVIADLARSPSVAAAVTQAQVRLSELLAATPQMEEVIRHSEAQHADIVDAIRRGDAAAARSAMHEHISGTASYLRGFLQ